MAQTRLPAVRSASHIASTGVEVDDYITGTKSIMVCVKEKNLARYRIQFIGDGGQVLQETAGTRANYAIRGDEQYVRAKVIDSNGRVAWCQPTFVRSRASSD